MDAREKAAWRSLDGWDEFYSGYKEGEDDLLVALIDAEYKQLLLASAKRGELRPNQKKHPLGGALSDYTSKSSNSYDPVFDKQIRKEAPHWFKRRTVIHIL